MLFDFTIVGSGVSGGRMAYELSRAGANCLLLEAGNPYSAQSFPPDEMSYSSQLFWGGGMELSQDARMAFLRAKCLGGGSVVYQALLDRFDDDALDDWKMKSGVPFFQLDEMTFAYETIEQEVPLETIPAHQRNRNAQIFTQACDQLDIQWSPLRRAQSDCRVDDGSDCIRCLGGCPRNSKQSTLVSLIPNAIKNGLQVESNVKIDQIHHGKDVITLFGWQNEQSRSFQTRKLILACGSLGNTEILLRSGFKNRLPALGEDFTCHPQFMSFGVFDEPVDAHKGAFQSVKSSDPSFRKLGFKFENVFAPPIGTAMLIPGRQESHLNAMKKYRHLCSAEVCLRDEATGKMNLDRNGKFVVEKSLTSEDQQKLQEGLEVMEEIFRASGAKEVIHGEQGFGLHLMGGCQIGVNSKTSVVNPDFELHNHPGIYIADSSIFPSAPGINPSLTIMALSWKASQKALQSL